MTITLPLRRMILHFSHIGFTDGRTFILVPPVADIFPQQIQAPSERMLNNYSKISTVFNNNFQMIENSSPAGLIPRKISRFRCRTCEKSAIISLNAKISHDAGAKRERL